MWGKYAEGFPKLTIIKKTWHKHIVFDEIEEANMTLTDFELENSKGYHANVRFK